MINHLISVIIPVYNVEPYLHRCLDSVISQTYKNLEIILIDDGSTDKSGLICDEYKAKDNRIVVIHQKNQGLSAARNAGLDICKGEYISFVDSDDYIALNYIDRLYEVCITNSTDLSVCSFHIVYENGRIIDGFSLLPDAIIDYTEFIKKGYYGMAWGKLYRKSIFKNIRFPINRINEDQYIYGKVCYISRKISVMSDKLYFYLKRNNGSLSTYHSIDAICSRLYTIRFLVDINFDCNVISGMFSMCIYNFYKFGYNKKDGGGKIRQDLALTYNCVKKIMNFKTKFKYRFPYVFFLIRKSKLFLTTHLLKTPKS